MLLIRYCKADGNHDFTIYFVISWLLLLFLIKPMETC
nr:MAG TPA: hypothetical protein [Caudoviricetes sp.]